MSNCLQLDMKKNYDKLRIASYFQLIFDYIDIGNDIMMKITQDICLKDTEINSRWLSKNSIHGNFYNCMILPISRTKY